MGRPRRRGRGGGRGGRGGGGPFTGKPDGLQPGDDIGNRRSHKQQQVPPDDIGNRKESEAERRFPADDVGNRIDAAPTHEVSGVLAELNGRRRRRPKGAGPAQRMGRYVVGGVNPMVAGNVQRAVEAMESAEKQRAAASPDDEDGDGKSRRRRRRRRDGRDQVDGVAAQEVSQRRAQRFFDFEEDDRFDYVLKSAPQQKCDDARNAVQRVLDTAGRDATVNARLLEDGDRPKVLIAIDDRGPAASLPEPRRAQNADEPLFVLGNAALMSLNYLVNKIVNRYPDDRIRLAILPRDDEKLYLDTLAEHRKEKAAAKNGATAAPVPAPVQSEPAESETSAAETGETAGAAEGSVAEPAEEEAEAPAPAAKKAAKKAATKKAASKPAATTTKKVAATKKVASKATAATKKTATKKATAKKAPTKKKAASAAD